MGNQQSIIQNIQAQVQKQTAAAASGAAANAAAADQSGAFKQQKRTELNMAKADVVKKQREYDNLTPDEALKRKTDEGTAEAARIIREFDASFSAETRVYNQTLDEIQTIANSPAFRLSQKYKKDLADKFVAVNKENAKIYFFILLTTLTYTYLIDLLNNKAVKNLSHNNSREYQKNYNF
jgi:hypothetical protein